ncbi:MAG: sugar MFS transporter [Bacteroidaceae bacterium]|nr:sugar MFS transporter [Bacteroidaceae bacterium]
MKTVEKKTLLPFILVTSLFLLWGLANNMTDTLLAAFKKIMSMSDTQTSLIQFAFYGAYFVIALPAALFIRKHSYKSGVVLGLCLYAGGAILFMPAAKTASYAFYLVAIYIMASGCSVLETTANPYIMAMGSPETATRRLNIAQAFNPIGSILGIILSKVFILKDISLYSVSGTYCALGVVLVFIMVVMLFSMMPEGRDNSAADSVGVTFRRLMKNRMYVFGVIAQFFYVGAQIGCWSFTIRIVMQELGMVEAQAASVYLYTIIGFCASRFIYTWLMKYFAPSKLLLFGSGMAVLFCVLVVMGQGWGWTMVVFLMLVSFFMSLMFPTIYGIALGSVRKGTVESNIPDDTKIGASGLIMAILGGALITPLQAMVSDAADIYLSYAVPAVCFAVVLAFSVYVVSKEKAS